MLWVQMGGRWPFADGTASHYCVCYDTLHGSVVTYLSRSTCAPKLKKFRSQERNLCILYMDINVNNQQFALEFAYTFLLCILKL